MTEKTNPKDQAESAAWAFLNRVFVRNSLVPVLTVATLVGWGFDLGGKTINGWHNITTLFSERTSVLTGAEIEVANEWVIYVDSGSEFMQVESHRTSLVSSAKSISDSSNPWSHFVRNLRVVRDPNQSGTWLLVADVIQGQSTKQETAATIDCISSKVASWFELDTFGSSFEAAHPFPYRISEFEQTYGRPTNRDTINYDESNLSKDGSDICPPPYD